MRIRLNCRSGSMAGQAFEFGEPVVSIGTADDNVLKVDPEKEPRVSGRHCEFFVKDGRVFIRDMDSKNGTIVNGFQIGEPRILNFGDSIRLGKGGPEFSLVAPKADNPLTMLGQMFPDDVMRVKPTKLAAQKQEGDEEGRKHLKSEIKLTCVRGTLEGRDFTFDDPLFTMGRDPSCNLQVDPHKDIRASGKHCEIFMLAGRYLIRDLNSSHGTFVNRKRIFEPTLLRTGSEVSLGEKGPAFVIEVSNEMALPPQLSGEIPTTMPPTMPPTLAPVAGDTAKPPPREELLRRKIDIKPTAEPEPKAEPKPEPRPEPKANALDPGPTMIQPSAKEKPVEKKDTPPPTPAPPEEKTPVVSLDPGPTMIRPPEKPEKPEKREAPAAEKKPAVSLEPAPTVIAPPAARSPKLQDAKLKTDRVEVKPAEPMAEKPAPPEKAQEKKEEVKPPAKGDPMQAYVRTSLTRTDIDKGKAQADEAKAAQEKPDTKNKDNNKKEAKRPSNTAMPSVTANTDSGPEEVNTEEAQRAGVMTPPTETPKAKLDIPPTRMDLPAAAGNPLSAKPKVDADTLMPPTIIGQTPVSPPPVVKDRPAVADDDALTPPTVIGAIPTTPAKEGKQKKPLTTDDDVPSTVRRTVEDDPFGTASQAAEKKKESGDNAVPTTVKAPVSKALSAVSPPEDEKGDGGAKKTEQPAPSPQAFQPTILEPQPAAAATPDAPPPGSWLDENQPPTKVSIPKVEGYRFLSKLGDGPIGEVYHVKHAVLKRVMALKVIRPTSEFPKFRDDDHKKFRQEIETAMYLEHPNIAAVFAIGDHEGNPHVAQEFCGGGSLAAHLQRQSLDMRWSVEVISKLAHALHACHQKGVFHRDLKTNNILFTNEGEPKLTDFGIGRLMEIRSTAGGNNKRLGEPCYMAPEQISSDGKGETAQTDIYGLGAILYEMLAGRPPVPKTGGPRTALELGQMVVNGQIAPLRQLNPQVPEPLEAICMRCLEKRPRDRYINAQELGFDLQRFMLGQPVKAQMPRSNAGVWALILGILILAVLGVTVMVAIKTGLLKKYLDMDFGLDAPPAETAPAETGAPTPESKPADAGK